MIRSTPLAVLTLVDTEDHSWYREMLFPDYRDGPGNFISTTF